MVLGRRRRLPGLRFQACARGIRFVEEDHLLVGRMHRQLAPFALITAATDRYQSDRCYTERFGLAEPTVLRHAT